mgnify:CR=1 FL=1
MKAEIAVMTVENIDRDAIARGGEILKNGGLVAFPTETVYGLGADALNEDAVNFEQSPQQLNKKILKDVRRQKTSIVLMHDLHETTNTVKALDPLIKTLKKEGYQILPITKNTKPLHHVSIDK